MIKVLHKRYSGLSFQKPTRAIVLVFVCFCLSSCFKEKPIKAPDYSNVGQLYTADLGENYTQQVYFNLQSHVFVDSNNKYDYDLAFDCDAFSFNVWVNGSKLMLVCPTGKADFGNASFSDTLNGWRVEYASGDPSICAFGPNSGLNGLDQVFLVNLGEDSFGVNLGFRKIKIGAFSSNSYQVTFCNMDGGDMHTAFVSKKDNRNKVFLSFQNGGIQRDFEPDYNNWDLLFTQYSVYFIAEKLPYKVTGILTNPHKTFAYFMDSVSNFDSITISNVINARFVPIPDEDVIGYNWKRFEYGGYTVLNNYNYIIKSDDRYYKLRLVDFYDSKGTKGYPKFQYVELR